MQRKYFRVVLATFILALLVSPMFVKGSQAVLKFNTQPLQEFSSTASRYYSRGLPNGLRYFIYVNGSNPDTEPGVISIDPWKQPDQLVFGWYNASAPQVNTTFHESVIVNNVYPYHYNFVIDSKGNIHLAYVANDYTLYYAEHPVNGNWTITALTDPKTKTYAMMPTIALGANDLPRIVYAEQFTSIGGTGYACMYAVYDGTTWHQYDVTDQHNGPVLNPSFIDILYPGLMIANGTAYIAYNNKVLVAASSRLQYLAINETGQGYTSYTPQTYRFAFRAATSVTTLTRPIMNLDQRGGIMIIFGSHNQGGIAYAYYKNATAPPPEANLQSPQNWVSNEVNLAFHSQEVLSTDTQVEPNGRIATTFSVFNLFDSKSNRFTDDVYLVTFDLTNDPYANHAVNQTLSRVTNTVQIYNTYPSIYLKDGSSPDITYLTSTASSKFATLYSSVVLPPVEIATNSGFAFAFLIVFFAALSYGWYYFVQKLPEPDVEEEIMPHMLNLKDSISKD